MAQKKAIVRNISRMTFAGKSDSNHWVTMDASEESGGYGAATSPMELLLIALGGCTGSDVVSILRKKRVPFREFEIHISAERAEIHPKVYTKIQIEYIVAGDSTVQQDVERAIELSVSKYCSVSAMLGKTAVISHTASIVGEIEGSTV